MIHFFYEHSSRPNNTVEMTIDEDSSIPEAVDAFKGFLAACGYVFAPGAITFRMPDDAAR